MFGLALLFVCVFLLCFWHFDHLALGRESWSLWLSCICVGCARVGLYRFFSFSWCQWLGASSACGSSWTFVFTFFSKRFL